MAGGRRKGGSGTGRLLLVGLLMLGLGTGLGWFLSQRETSAPAPVPGKKGPKVPPRAPQAPRAEEPPAADRGNREPEVEKPLPKVAEKPESGTERRPRPEPPAKVLPRMAVVIDDLGYAPPELVTRLCAQPVPLSLAVLPFLPNTRRSAEIGAEKGKEILLHLPLEPQGYPGPSKDPGPGAIFFHMKEAEVRLKVRQAMLEIPGRKGVNNHMGSRMTPDRTRMGWVLEEVKTRGYFFLDSRTEKDSVAWDVAKGLGMRSVQRKVFLDDSKDFGEMRKQWDRALELARKDGEVVIIGHIYPETVAALEKLVPASQDRVRFVFVGDLAR